MRRMAMVALIVLCVGVGCSELKRLAYEGVGRDSWQQPDRVLRELALAPGAHVADVGAGGGYFTFKLAEAVGSGGAVFAVDVDEDMTAYLEERAAEEGASNVRVILGDFDDPLLPDGEIDLLFTSNTYHHIENRVEYFRRLLEDLTPDGRIAILELNGASWFPRTFGHYTDADVIIEELSEAGYVLDRQLDFIDRQSFLIFRRK